MQAIATANRALTLFFESCGGSGVGKHGRREGAFQHGSRQCKDENVAARLSARTAVDNLNAAN
eukprot:2731185-Pleurochrysis_carterae.AAC.4